MFKADEYRLKVKDLSKDLKDAATALMIDQLKIKASELAARQEQPEVWQDLELTKKIGREHSAISSKINAYESLKKSIQDAMEIIDLIEESQDLGLISELDDIVLESKKKTENLLLQTLLKGKYDSNNAILMLHSGAGGTESCDWVSMLYRMYCRYAEQNGFKIVELDKIDGDEAGIKSVDFKIEGLNAYGYLKAEQGVHRLVRISPFDSNKRRHTSFASLEVLPEIVDDSEITVLQEDLRVDTFRSSGAGGQHVNKTESAIRITHIPTGIVVACQNQRSQIQNREMAMNMLKSKLLELKERERMAEEQSLKGAIKKIEWGSQIRSYVFCPYTLVKDHRTGFETGNIAAVMDGDIEAFIIDYLKKA